MPSSHQKKPKSLLENKDAALALAKSIVDDQEDKTQKRIEKHQHQGQLSHSKGREVAAQSKYTKSRRRLEEVKIAVAARAAQSKREKAKVRHAAKKREHDCPDSEQVPPKPQPQKATRRRVMFSEES